MQSSEMPLFPAAADIAGTAVADWSALLMSWPPTARSSTQLTNVDLLYNISKMVLKVQEKNGPKSKAAVALAMLGKWFGFISLLSLLDNYKFKIRNMHSKFGHFRRKSISVKRI